MSEYQFNPNVEQWKAIPDFPGYEVSDHGRVRSFHKRHYQDGHKGVQYVLDANPQTILKPSLDQDGYSQIDLCRNRGRHSIKVHQLVLLAFVGPCPEGLEACHNDGNHARNYFDNLRWDTHFSNMMDKHPHGTMAKGIKHGNTKSTEQQVIEIRNFYLQKRYTQKELAEIYNISQSTICQVIHRKTWKHI